MGDGQDSITTRRHRSGEYDAGRQAARLDALEARDTADAEEHRRIFEALDKTNITLAVLVDHSQKQNADIARFMDTCGSCRDEITTLGHRVSRVEKETETGAIQRKVQPVLAKPLRPWEKPIGEFATDIVLGGLKLVGVSAVAYLILLGVGNASLP